MCSLSRFLWRRILDTCRRRYGSTKGYSLRNTAGSSSGCLRGAGFCYSSSSHARDSLGVRSGKMPGIPCVANAANVNMHNVQNNPNMLNYWRPPRNWQLSNVKMQTCPTCRIQIPLITHQPHMIHSVYISVDYNPRNANGVAKMVVCR